MTSLIGQELDFVERRLKHAVHRQRQLGWIFDQRIGRRHGESSLYIAADNVD